MTLPEFIKVGGYNIAVVYVNNLMTDEGNCGNYNARTQTISIDDSLCADLKYGVFLHEVIEAVKEIYHIDALKGDHHAIEQLGEALHALFRDNGEKILP